MSTSFTVTPAFLNTIKALWPQRASSAPTTRKSVVLNNPWYIVAAVTYSASNRPEAVPRVWEHALQDVRAVPADEGTGGGGEEFLLARRIREALFKSGLTCGYSKVINALRALHAVMPEELQDKSILRNQTENLKQVEERAEVLFRTMYGVTADTVQATLDAIYPDMGYFSKTIGYGLVYSEPSSFPSPTISTPVLPPLESSYAIAASLIATDTPQQIAWHLDNARRQSGLAEARAVREMAVEVAKQAGVRWLNEVPELEE
ncbi:hypothetical protein BJ165DRAFT_1418664 [Panaeolus papilionaceus]|nr:hypothetical protein BJ165DRAFT_1418664 [Panaeolus papilionaceus]